MHEQQRQSLDKLYSRLPSIDCKGLCHTSCGPVAMTDVEIHRILEERGAPIPPPCGLDCPLLTKEKRCSVYTIRPLICRLWGVVETLPCTYGCKPKPRYLTDDEAGLLLMAAHQVGGDEWWIGDLSAVQAQLAKNQP